MEKDKLQRMQGIGLLFIGLSVLITIGTVILHIKANSIIFIVIGVILFLIGAYYSVKAEIIRRGTKKK